MAGSDVLFFLISMSFASFRVSPGSLDRCEKPIGCCPFPPGVFSGFVPCFRPQVLLSCNLSSLHFFFLCLQIRCPWGANWPSPFLFSSTLF